MNCGLLTCFLRRMDLWCSTHEYSNRTQIINKCKDSMKKKNRNIKFDVNLSIENNYDQ